MELLLVLSLRGIDMPIIDMKQVLNLRRSFNTGPILDRIDGDPNLVLY